MTFRFLISFMLIFVGSLFSQHDPLSSQSFRHKNSVQIEALGHGLYYSVNYERAFFNKPRFKTMGQIGLEYIPGGDFKTIGIPLVVTELFSFNKHHLELGLAYLHAMQYYQKDPNTLQNLNGLLSGRIAYRFQKPNGRFIFRFGFTPFLSTYDFSFYFTPSIGLSFGFAF